MMNLYYVFLFRYFLCLFICFYLSLSLSLFILCVAQRNDDESFKKTARTLARPLAR